MHSQCSLIAQMILGRKALIQRTLSFQVIQHSQSTQLNLCFSFIQAQKQYVMQMCDANVMQMYLGLETLFIKYKVKILTRKHDVEI